MSREIVILRHAQAEPNAGTQRDFDRTLSPRGPPGSASGSLWPKPGVSGAMQVKCAPQRSISASYSADERGLWWTSSSGGPDPARR